MCANNSKAAAVAAFLSPNGQIAVLAELTCQTASVAASQPFQQLCRKAANALAITPEATLAEEIGALAASTAEDIQLSRFFRIETTGNGKAAILCNEPGTIAVLVHAVVIKAASLGHPELDHLLKDLAEQVATNKPIATTRGQVERKTVIKEEDAIEAGYEARIEKAYAENADHGKAVVLEFEAARNARMNDFFSKACLLEQPFIKNPNITTREQIAAVAKQIGDRIRIDRFACFQAGESNEGFPLGF
jgi:elongation factor Ts